MMEARGAAGGSGAPRSPRRQRRSDPASGRRGSGPSLEHSVRVPGPRRGRENLTILADTLIDRFHAGGRRAVAGPSARAAAPQQMMLTAAPTGSSQAILLRSGRVEASDRLQRRRRGSASASRTLTRLPSSRRRRTTTGAGLSSWRRSRSRATRRPLCFPSLEHQPEGSRYAPRWPRTWSRARRGQSAPDHSENRGAAARSSTSFLTDPRDAGVLADGVERSARWQNRIGGLAGREVFPGREVDEREHMAANDVASSSHIGTCAIGRSSKRQQRHRARAPGACIVADASNACQPSGAWTRTSRCSGGGAGSPGGSSTRPQAPSTTPLDHRAHHRAVVRLQHAGSKRGEALEGGERRTRRCRRPGDLPRQSRQQHGPRRSVLAAPWEARSAAWRRLFGGAEQCLPVGRGLERRGVLGGRDDVQRGRGEAAASKLGPRRQVRSWRGVDAEAERSRVLRGRVDESPALQRMASRRSIVTRA